MVLAAKDKYSLTWLTNPANCRVSRIADATETNILSVFAKTGIWPYNPHIVLSVVIPLRQETPPEISPDTIATPYTAKCMRQFSRKYMKNPTKEAIRKLIKANETNSARVSIAEHRAEGLKEALQIEKKKRCRGKKLNLTGDPAGKAQFFRTAEVIIAQVLETEKVTKVEQDKLNEEKRKENAKIVKTIELQVRAENHEQEKLERAAAKKAAKNIKPSHIVIFKVGSSIPSNMDVLEEAVVEEPITEAVGVVLTSQSGRPIVLITRFPPFRLFSVK